MKIKIFRDNDEPRDPESFSNRCVIPLEQRINDFIQDKDVVDIKYQSNISGYCNDTQNGSDWIEQSLVMYNERAEENK